MKSISGSNLSTTRSCTRSLHPVRQGKWYKMFIFMRFTLQHLPRSTPVSYIVRWHILSYAFWRLLLFLLLNSLIKLIYYFFSYLPSKLLSIWSYNSYMFLALIFISPNATAGRHTHLLTQCEYAYIFTTDSEINDTKSLTIKETL